MIALVKENRKPYNLPISILVNLYPWRINYTSQEPKKYDIHLEASWQ